MSTVFELQSAARGTANAPRGAMQFEITNPALAEALCPFVWVRQKQTAVVAGTKCEKCKDVYPVIVELMPKELQAVAHAAMLAEGTQWLCICECNGRVIE